MWWRSPLLTGVHVADAIALILEAGIAVVLPASILAVVGVARPAAGGRGRRAVLDTDRAGRYLVAIGVTVREHADHIHPLTDPDPLANIVTDGIDVDFDHAPIISLETQVVVMN